MKKVNFLTAVICVLCATSTGYAQLRYADMKIEFVTPEPNTVIQSPQILQFSFQILNQGPDTIFPTDSFIYMPAHYFNISSKDRRITFNQILAPNDSFIIHDTITVDGNKDKYPFELVLASYPYAFSADLGHGRLVNEFWEDRADNAPKLQLVHRANKLSIGNLKLEDRVVQIYPNPCTQNTVFVRYQGENINLRIFDVRGKIQPFDWIETHSIYPERGVKLRNAAKGLYFFHFSVQNENIVEKVVYE